MPADVFSLKARHEPISARSHNDVSVAHCLSADSIFELQQALQLEQPEKPFSET